MSKNRLQEIMKGSGIQLCEAELLAFEQKLGTRLPADYRDFLLQYNGGTTEPFHTVPFRILRKNLPDAFMGSLVTDFFSLNNPPESLDAIFSETYTVRQFKNNYLMVASGRRVYNYMLSLEKKSYGQIFLWDTIEQQSQGRKTPSMRFAAPSFQAFIDILMTPEEFDKWVDEELSKMEPTPVYQERPKRLLTDADIQKLEIGLKHRLPEDYKAFLRTNNGTENPVNNIYHFFDIERQRPDSSDLRLFYSAGGGRFTDNLESKWEMYVTSERVPKDCLPIGEDSFGNVLCLDLSNKYYGRVWFWPHDSYGPEGSYEPMSPVADSFEAFLSILQKD